MKQSKSYKFCLWKAYFEKGYALTNYVKYLLAVIGIAAVMKDYSLMFIVFLGLIYAVICFFIGWAWFRFGIITQEIEVSNRFNLFVKEMRKTIK